MADGKRILIAEDEVPMAKALKLKLEGDGHIVDTVHDGAAVSEKLETETYDLILLDLMMPKKDGYAVLEDMKQTKNNTAVVVASNLGQQEDISRATSYKNVVSYFIKANSSLNDIIKQINDHFQEGGTSSAKSEHKKGGADNSTEGENENQNNGGNARESSEEENADDTVPDQEEAEPLPVSN